MKLEYDQCFYKYIEQKTKELFMSVHSVNGISQMQNAQGVSFGSSNQDDGSGPDIGKLLVGTVLVAAVAGVGIAGYKSGKTSALTKEGDGVLATVWNGIKSWFGKNGDDVAQVAKNDISAECKTSLKTLFSGGEISQTQKQDILENADEISKVFSEKATKNAKKADKLAEIAKIENNDEKTKALADFLKVKGDLTLDGKTLKAVSADDQAIIARKLNRSPITEGSIDDIIEGLQTKYRTKQQGYNFTSINFKDLINTKTKITATETLSEDIIAKRFNRAGAAQKIVDSCTGTSSYINTQASLAKWLKAGDLTQDEYDNLRALAEQKFMSHNSGTDYLKYLEQTLKKADGSEIKFDSLDDESINLLNDKFKGLNIPKASSGKATNLTAQQLIDWKRNNTKSISEYLGLNGAQIPPGWTIENNALHFKGKLSKSSITLNKTRINVKTYENKYEGKFTGYTIDLETLRKIFPSTPVTT